MKNQIQWPWITSSLLTTDDDGIPSPARELSLYSAEPSVEIDLTESENAIHDIVRVLQCYDKSTNLNNTEEYFFSGPIEKVITRCINRYYTDLDFNLRTIHAIMTSELLLMLANELRGSQLHDDVRLAKWEAALGTDRIFIISDETQLLSQLYAYIDCYVPFLVERLVLKSRNA